MVAVTATASAADRITAIVLVVVTLAATFSLANDWLHTDSLLWATRVVAVVVGVWAGMSDLRRRRVPNVATLPLILAALALALLHLVRGDWGVVELGGLAVIWVVCLAAWVLRLFGGGDAKLAMGLLGLFPTQAAVTWVLIGLLAGGLVYLTFGPRRDAWRRVWIATMLILARRAPPSRIEVEAAYRERSHPAAPWISIGFCAHILLHFGGLG